MSMNQQSTNYDKLNKYRQKIKQNIITNDRVSQQPRAILPKTILKATQITTSSFSPLKTISKSPSYNMLNHPVSPTFKNEKSLSPSRISQSSSYTFYQQQISNLLQQNQILSMTLADKNQMVKKYQREGYLVSMQSQTEIKRLDEQIRQFTKENQFLKKSNHQQLFTLRKQLEKINQEILNKDYIHNQQVAKLKQTHIEQFQQCKKLWSQQQKLLKSQIQKLQLSSIQKQTVNKQRQSQQKLLIQQKQQQLHKLSESLALQQHNYKSSLQCQSSTYQKKLTQLRILQSQTISNLTNQNQSKLQQLKLIIEQKDKQIFRIQEDKQRLKCQMGLYEVKATQQRTKLIVELRNQKDKAQQRLKQDRQTAYTIKAIQNSIKQQNSTIILQEKDQQLQSLKQLITNKNIQIQGLSHEIQSLRQTYQKNMQQKNTFIKYLQQQQQNLIKTTEQQTQCLKIKIACLNQANLTSLTQLYQTKNCQQSLLLLQKESCIQSLSQKLSSLLKQQSLTLTQHHQQVANLLLIKYSLQNQIKQYQIKINNKEKESLLRDQHNRDGMKLVENTNIKESKLKDQTIKRLTTIIQEKDTEIQQLEQKLRTIKDRYQQETKINNQQHEIFIKQKQAEILQLKIQLDYQKKQANKRQQQLKRQKQYFSNEMKDIKAKGSSDFQTWVTKVGCQNNQLKAQLNQTIQKLSLVQQQFTTYKSLWNSEQTTSSLSSLQSHLHNQYHQSTLTTNNLLNHYEQQIKYLHQEILSLQKVILQRQNQINDMKGNYHDIQRRLGEVMEAREARRQLDQMVLNIGIEQVAKVTQSLVIHKF